MKIAIYRAEKRFIDTPEPINHMKKEIYNDEGFIILNKLKILKQCEKILDAGCGYGRWCIVLREKGFNVYGLDLNLYRLNYLRKLGIPLILADIRNLPIHSCVFDAILSWGVIEHLIEGPEIAIKEAYRCIKHNGYLIITVPFLSINRLLNPVVVIQRLLGRNKFFRRLFRKGEKNFFCYEFSIGSFKSCLQKMGFNIYFYSPIYVDWGLKDAFRIFYPLVAQLSTLNSKLFKYIFGSFILFVCRAIK